MHFPSRYLLPRSPWRQHWPRHTHTRTHTHIIYIQLKTCTAKWAIIIVGSYFFASPKKLIVSPIIFSFHWDYCFTVFAHNLTFLLICSPNLHLVVFARSRWSYGKLYNFLRNDCTDFVILIRSLKSPFLSKCMGGKADLCYSRKLLENTTLGLLWKK